MRGNRLSVALEAVAQDISYGFRMLRKSPVLTVVAVLSLALGIGPNTAIFSLVNSFLLRPVPVAQPDQLVSLYTVDAQNPGKLQLSYLNYQSLKDQKQVFSDVLVYTPAFLSMNDGERPEKILSEAVSDNYFDLLGVKAGLGRTFFQDENRTQDSAPVVVLSHNFWRRRFGSDTNLIGKTLRLNRQPFTVIGVAPEGFTGTDLGAGPDLWLPLLTFAQITPGVKDWCDNRRFLFLDSIGRLQPGVTVPQAQSAVTALSTKLEQDYPNENAGRTMKFMPLLQARIDPDNKGTYFFISVVLMVLVGIILLIACINVASLLLARAGARQREIAIRAAIGASRLRLIRQLITESVILALIGGAVGLGLAFWSKDLLWSLRPSGVLTDRLEISLDSRVFIFTLLLSLLSGIIFGLVPALHASKLDVVSMLKGDVTMPSQHGAAFSLQKALIIIQVALCLVSLIGAGMFVKSLYNARAVKTGFNADNLLLASLDMGFEGYNEAKGKQLYKQLVESVEALPGVERAVLARGRPFREPYRRTVFIEGQEVAGGKGILIATNQVGLRYFETLGIPLVRGRDFNESDDESGAAVSIVNEAMAQRFWPGQDAVGKRFKLFGEKTFREIVGVVKNTNVKNVGEEPQPYVYLPLLQNYAASVTLFVRTSNEPRAVVAAVQNQAQQLDSNLLLFDTQTFRELLDKTLWATRAGASLLTAFGLLALLLAAVGIFGVMSYFISRRTREIGIRMALGAQKRDVLKMVFRQGMLLVIIGIIIGSGAALILTRLVTRLLFGVGALDAATFIAASLVLAAVALIAILIPARKAARIDPLVAVRTE